MVPRKVLVAIETASCRPALEAAAIEAGRRGCGVHLVHVMPPVYARHPHLEELRLVADDLQRAGEAVTSDAATVLRQLMTSDATVSTELCHGSVISSLLDASRHACVLVLQHHEQRHDGRPHLLSVVQAVVARSACPVLVVPETWVGAAGDAATTPPLVVAGVQDAASSTGVVEAGVAEATRRRGRLRLVHAAVVPDAPDMEAATYGAWTRRLQRALETDFADLCTDRSVPVEVLLVPQRPATALVEQLATADLLVVGRGHSRLPFVARPGPVTADLLRQATRPVLVVDSPPTTQPPAVRRLSEVTVP